MKTLNLDSKNLFFCADLHLYHANSIEFCNRPVKDLEEMHETIIKNWNNKIPPESTVFILGDVSWKGAGLTNKILKRLNGYKILINGNHDTSNTLACFVEKYDMLGINVKHNNKITSAHLCHYSINDWWKIHKGSLQLHGHEHNNCENKITGNKRMDVGIDGNNLTPYSWEEILKIFNICQN